MRSRLTAAIATAVLGLALAAPAQGASGTWDRAWGSDVNGDGAGVVGICTVAANCHAGSGATNGTGGEMFNPAGVAVDSAGNLYVADSGNNRIQKFDSAGKFLRAWGDGVAGGTGFEICTVAADCAMGTRNEESGAMKAPSDVAVDSGGNVYVTDFDNNRVERFSSTGIFERTWGKGVNMTTGGNLCTLASGNTCQAGAVGGQAGELNQPIGLATDSSDNVYVADSSNNRIQKFDASGTFDRTWGKGVNATTAGNLCTAVSGNTCQAGGATTALGGEMNTPAGVAVDSGGNVFVADALNNRIQRFDTSGGWQRAWGVHVNGGSGFGVCTSAALCQAGTTGGLGGQMFFPIDVGTDSVGNVYVADYGNSRIQKFASSGTWDRAWGKDVNGGSVFGICTVAASCQVGTSGGLGGEMDTPAGVATDLAGDLYVGDYLNNRIQKFVDPAVVPPPSTTPNPGPSPAPATKKKCKKPKKRAAAAKKCKKAKKK
jgi:tripartite motif-containing protein 71